MQMSSDLNEIRAAAETYLDGLYEGDVAKLGAVFHPTCALTAIVDGKLSNIPRDQWFELVKNRESPQAAGKARDDMILAIDLIGPEMAHVKLKCAVPPRYFTDILSFLKIDGRWQIAQKVYRVDVRS
jgi:hypothetical protein